MSRIQPTRSRLVSIVEAALVLVVLAAILAAAALPAFGRQKLPRAWTPVKVERGGSLWSIARTHPMPDMTTAELVEVIRTENSIDDQPRPGDVVRVPRPEVFDAALCSR